MEQVDMAPQDGIVQLSIRDDGIGTASFDRGPWPSGSPTASRRSAGRSRIASKPGGVTAPLVTFPMSDGS
jgi:hypothetical protein